MWVCLEVCFGHVYTLVLNSEMVEITGVVLQCYYMTVCVCVCLCVCCVCDS